jgi:hypothetical protein
MRLEERTQVDRVPGTSQTTSRKMREWVCPDCDYFEELVSDEDEQTDGTSRR